MLSEANLFHSPRYFEQISPARAGILSVSLDRQSFRINKIYQAGVEEREKSTALLPVEIRSVLRVRTPYLCSQKPSNSPDLIVLFAFCLVNICSLSGLSRGKLLASCPRRGQVRGIV